MKIFQTHIYIYNYTIYLYLKNPPHLLIYLMEKPGNLFATVKILKKHPKEKTFKKRIFIFNQKFTLGKFSVPA